MPTSRPDGRTGYIHADARDPAALLADPAVSGTLDRTRPIALLFSSVLMCLPDEQAHDIVRTLLAQRPPGSHLMITHPAGVTALFAGLDLLEPGVAPLPTCRLRTPPRDPRRVHHWVGIAVKPG